MKAGKVLLVIILFAVVIFMALGLKKRIVQTSCSAIGNYKATKSEEVSGSDNNESWYCCPKNKDKNIKECIYYGE